MKYAIALLAIIAVASGELCGGINVWTSHGPGGGSIQAVVIDPTNPGTLYAAASGQVFKSANGGASWNSASSGLRSGFVGYLAVDPQNPGTVYTCCGLIFKSTDGAKSWNALSPLGIAGSPPVPGGAWSLAVDPQNSGTLYAGSSGGVLKSTDGGASWAAASSGLPRAGNVLIVDPQNPKTVYAWLGSAGTASPGGLFKSTDGAASWNAPLTQKLVALSKVSTATCDDWGYYFSQVMGYDAPAPEDISCLAADGSRDQLISADQYVADLQAYTARRQYAGVGLVANVTALVVDPQNPSTLYSTTYNGIFKSTDGGLSWNTANAGLSANGSSPPAIDPRNPGTLYTTLLRCDAAGCGVQVYKSMDGAVSWNAVGSRFQGNGAPGALAIDPKNPSTLYAGSNAGVLKSTDGGVSWNPMNLGLAASNINSLVVDPQNRGTIFAGIACCGGPALFKSADGGTTWTDTGLSAAYVNALAVDPQNSATVYASTNTGVFKSTDGGATWASTGLTPPTYRITIDPQNPSTLYATNGGMSGGILKSTDGGTTWSAVNSGLASAGGNTPFIGFLTLDPQSPNTLYAGRYDTGQIFQTTDGAGSWSALTPGWDTSLFHLGLLAADPQTSGTLYAGTTVFDCGDELCPPGYWDKVNGSPGPGIFKSTDGGNSWARLDGVLGVGFGYSLAVDPKGTLYVAVDYYNPPTVFRSTDGGASWKAVGAGLTGSVSALAVDGQDPNTVYAATRGGGVFAITFASQ